MSRSETVGYKDAIFGVMSLLLGLLVVVLGLAVLVMWIDARNSRHAAPGKSAAPAMVMEQPDELRRGGAGERRRARSSSYPLPGRAARPHRRVRSRTSGSR